MDNISFQEDELSTLDEILSTKSYLCDVLPTQLDILVHTAILKCDKKSLKRFTNLKRWFCHIGSYSKSERAKFQVNFNEQTAQLVSLLAKAHAERKVKDLVRVVYKRTNIIFLTCFRTDYYIGLYVRLTYLIIFHRNDFFLLRFYDHR